MSALVRRLLRSRYAVVLGLLALATALWNLYVITHDDGIVSGRVVGPDGRPVAGATVTLFERTLTTLEPRIRVVTDGDGRFRFTGQRTHHLVLVAEQPGIGITPRQAHRLYFRGQNLVLREPMRLGAGR
jgi:protocatechuate 3,4-dioxygenase beta subunit